MHIYDMEIEIRSKLHKSYDTALPFTPHYEKKIKNKKKQKNLS